LKEPADGLRLLAIRLVSLNVIDYATRLAARRNELLGKYAGQNVGLDNPDFLTPQQVQEEASDEINDRVPAGGRRARVHGEVPDEQRNCF
jgi:hypothetical protein